MQKIYLDVHEEMIHRTFIIEYEEAHDLTGLRDYQFIKRGVEPVYKPVNGLKTTSAVPINYIVDLIHKGVGFNFQCDEDLFQLVNVLKIYIQEWGGKYQNLDKMSNEYIFFERCTYAFRQLTTLANERQARINRLSGVKTGIDRIPLRR